MMYGEGDDPLIINSGYRSPQVNKAVGGVATSNHLTGCAADIRVSGQEQLIRYACILLDVSDESGEDFDELLRTRWNMMYGEGNDPLIINSGYRSPQVNKAVGGVATSNHLTGCAVDVRVSGQEQLIRYACILLDVSDESGEDFDELLLERKGAVMWLHLAVRPSDNRRRVRML